MIPLRKGPPRDMYLTIRNLTTAGPWSIVLHDF